MYVCNILLSGHVNFLGKKIIIEALEFGPPYWVNFSISKIQTKQQ